MIQAKGRDFVPSDKEVAEQFKNLTFNLTEVVRILTDPDPLFIANKMISFVNFSYLSGKRGIHVTGALLGSTTRGGGLPNSSSGTKRN